MKAASAAGTVKRVVVTSSIAAVTYGHPERGQKPYTEEDWTQLDNANRPVAPYPKSKTLGEQAAWDFIRKKDFLLRLISLKNKAEGGESINNDDQALRYIHAAVRRLVRRGRAVARAEVVS